MGWLERGWVLLTLTAAGCPQPSPGTAVARLTAVCAPDRTQSGQSFTLGVTGGCGGTSADYRCVVNKVDGLLEVTLLGPSPCEACTCLVVEQVCSVPALEAGGWSLVFLENTSFNRTVDVAPQHPVFQCNPPDAGI